jgi:hypothetical protein
MNKPWWFWYFCDEQNNVLTLYKWEKGTNIKVVLMKLQQAIDYKWQVSILLKIFKALCAAGRKCMITGILSTKNKILEVCLSPFYEQSLDFAETDCM